MRSGSGKGKLRRHASCSHLPRLSRRARDRAMCRRRADLVIENLALRQQVTALKKERPRPLLDDVDRAFWVALRTSWPSWASRLVIVNTDTVARWNRERFRRYWTRISSRRYSGRPRIDAEIRRLVRTMAQNGWGAPRIHAELTKLGFIISEITVSRYMPRRPAEPDQVKRWIAFLRNHKDDIAAMDLFTVPTASLRLLYGFFVIEHGRQHIVHFNATFHPTSAWVIQQLREAFPYDTAPRYLIFDGDAIFSPAVVEFIRAMGTKPIRISYRSPWQNGTAERWIGKLSARAPGARCGSRRAPSRPTRPVLHRLLSRGLVVTWDSTKTRRTRDRSRRDRHRPQKSLHFREWAGCTIATNGARQLRAISGGQRARDRSS